MADNPFDQFDTAASAAPAAPATTAAAAPPPAATPPAASSNPFDQFDGHAQPHHYQVRTPSGHTYEFDAPADATPQQLDAMSRKAAGYGDQYPVTAPKPAGQPGVGEQLWDATKNDVAGIAQGAAALPDIAARAVGKIISVVPNVIGEGLRAAGHHDAADWIQSNVTHPLANPTTMGGMIEDASPTPDSTSGKVSRFVANLAGGAAAVPASAVDSLAARLVGDAPKGMVVAKAAPAAASEASPSYAELARDLNIRRTPATNSGTGTATVMQAGLGALPGGAPIGAAAARETGDLASAAKGVAENVGEVSDRQGAGEALAQGAQSYKQASGATAKGMYQQRDALIGGSDTPVATGNAAAAINDMASKFPTSPAIQQLREHPVIRAIEGALPKSGQSPDIDTRLQTVADKAGFPIDQLKANFDNWSARDGPAEAEKLLASKESELGIEPAAGGQPLTLGEATEALSHVRGVQRNLAAQSNTTSPILARVNQLEQGLEDDVMAAANKADVAAGRTPGAEGSAVKAQRDADAFYADRAGALNGSLKRPLQSAADDTKVSGEAVYNQVAGDMDAKSGNLARLRDTWFRLPPEAKSTFAATKIDDLGRAMPGQQNDMGSAWSFNTFLTNLNKLSPQARNIVFGAKADGDIQKIATYADRLRQLDKARNFSNTAQKYFAGAFMATVGGAVMHGDIGHAVDAAMALPATWGGAKLLLATPAMRDWTAQAMRASLSGNETAMRVLTKKLGTIASAQPAIANQTTGLQDAITRAANDNLHSLAASRGQQNPQGEQKKAQGAR